MAYFVYVTISEEDRIARFAMDADTGRLEPLGSVAVAGRPAPLATDPQRRFLYVGQRDSNQLSSYRIDPKTGGISLIGTIPLESDPCYLNTDRKGRFLLSAYYNAGHAAVHAIGDDGAVTHPPVEWRTTGTGAHSMQTDPTNRFAFVPHIANRGGPNAIFQFRFDENTGRLTPNEPLMLKMEKRLGPRHFCFHPNRDILYFTDEQGCSVSAYHLDTQKGTLSHFQTISTLPEDYTGNNSCAQIQIHPSGKFLYAPNRGHNSIACFAVDAATGRLSSIARVPTEPIPRVVSVDPSGKFFYAAGLESGRLAAYRIAGDGNLGHIETYDVGKAPMWVMIVAIEE
jgi:6-phosphogluconolactonase